MSARIITVAIALAAGALGSCGASSGHGGSTGTPSPPKAAACHPHGARTLTANRRARVFVLAGHIYGCSERTGQRSLLGQTGSCIGTDRAGPVALAQETVGYAVERCGVDTGFTQVFARRLSDGKVLLGDPAIARPLGPESYVSVGSIVVKSDGSVAWIASGTSLGTREQRTEVDRADKAGQRVLDSSAAIDPGSLRLHGSQLIWKSGHATHSAPLS